jgi:hypothetical protein
MGAGRLRSGPSVRAIAVGAVVFLTVCAAPGVGIARDEEKTNLGPLTTYGERMASGEIPYRDFFIEYPPAALPVIALPALAPGKHFASAFKALQIVFGLGTIGFVVAALAGVGASSRHLLAAAAFTATAPVILGPTVLHRYDLWPAFLLVAALAALVGGRIRVSFALLAIAALAKGYALVVLPVALWYVFTRGGWTGVRRALVAHLASAAIVLLPFIALAPGGVRYSFWTQFSRGLHLESLAGSALAAADRLELYRARVVAGYSQDEVGRLPDILATLTTLVLFSVLVCVWLLFRRREPSGERLLVAAAAAVTAFVAFNKVLSPQFLIWLIPLVALLPRRTAVPAGALLLVALALTRSFFPARYGEIVALGPPLWLLVARNACLVVLTGLLVAALQVDRAPPDARVRRIDPPV